MNDGTYNSHKATKQTKKESGLCYLCELLLNNFVFIPHPLPSSQTAITIFLIFAMLVTSSCSHLSVGTGTMSPQQVQSANKPTEVSTVYSLDVSDRDENVILWKQKLSESTKAAVTSNIRDLDKVKSLVAEQTSTELENVRCSHIEHAIAFIEESRSLSFTNNPSAQSFLKGSIDAARKSIGPEGAASLIKKRDRLIEQYFKEAVKEADSGKSSQPTNAP